MKTMQYTIRGIAPQVDRAVRQAVASSHQSLNAVLIESLARGLGLGKEPVRQNDLDDLAGSWVHDPEFDRAVADMDKVDEALWK